MKIKLLVIAIAAYPFSAYAEPMKFSCERFKSNCLGKACEQIYVALQKDASRQILSVKKTETVEYEINETGATEKLVGAQIDPSIQRSLTINYKNIASAYGKITLSNKDAKGNVKEMASIEPASGFYRYLLIHTDGSIKEVPIGEPYTAYFGWCNNLLQPQQAQPAAAPETAAPLTAPASQ